MRIPGGPGDQVRLRLIPAKLPAASRAFSVVTGLTVHTADGTAENFQKNRLSGPSFLQFYANALSVDG